MNETVLEYCKKFIKSKNEPRFALLIKGKWGVGKTFFIKEMIKELKLKPEDYVYLSLYGVNAVDEINMKIFEAMHPTLSSPKMKLFGSVLKSALKLGAGFKLDLPFIDKEIDAKIETGELDLKSFGKIRSKRSLVIVDDIERLGNSLPLKDVFGFFQDLIVESETKVIFVGNEEKVECGQSNSSYTEIKEKTIGQEFLIQPDHRKAIDAFINEELQIEKPFNDFVEKCINEVVKKLECTNLRCIRSALWNLNECSDFIMKDLDEDVRESFVTIFLSLSIQKSLNDIEKSEVSDAIRVYAKYQMGYKKYKLEHGQEKDNSAFMSYFGVNVPIFNLWDRIIFDGMNSKLELFAAYKLERDARKKKHPSLLFQLIGGWQNYEDAEYKRAVDQLVSEMDAGKYRHPGEMLHYADIMLSFSLWGLRKESVASIQRQINNVYTSGNAYLEKDFDRIRFSFAGWSYSANHPSFKKIHNFVEQKNYEFLTKSLSSQVNVDVANLTNANVSDFCSNLWRVSGTNKYWKFPFFKYVDVFQFCEVFDKLNVDSKNLLLDSLEERYGLRYKSPAGIEDEEDLKVLCKIKDVYSKGLRSVLNSPSKLYTKYMVERLGRIINHIEICKKNRKLALGVEIPISNENVRETKNGQKAKAAKKKGL